MGGGGCRCRDFSGRGRLSGKGKGAYVWRGGGGGGYVCGLTSRTGRVNGRTGMRVAAARKGVRQRGRRGEGGGRRNPY